MKTFQEYITEKGRCWTGYKPTPGKKPYSDNSCVKEDGVAAAPTNSVGSGAVAGTGGTAGEPGVSKKRNPLMSFMKRKQPKM
jgi:hypothetical protein